MIPISALYYALEMLLLAATAHAIICAAGRIIAAIVYGIVANLKK